MQATCCSLLAFLFLTGCSSERTAAESRRRVADKEVNTKHLKGTTDVLKNYRYGERPDAGKATSDKKPAVSAEKAK
jgi:hypothetical protein